VAPGCPFVLMQLRTEARQEGMMGSRAMTGVRLQDRPRRHRPIECFPIASPISSSDRLELKRYRDPARLEDVFWLATAQVAIAGDDWILKAFQPSTLRPGAKLVGLLGPMRTDGPKHHCSAGSAVLSAQPWPNS